LTIERIVIQTSDGRIEFSRTRRDHCEFRPGWQRLSVRVTPHEKLTTQEKARDGYLRESMKLVPLSVVAVLVAGSIVACVGSDPSLNSDPTDDAGGDTSVAASDSGADAADALLATDTGDRDVTTDAADATQGTPKTWTCTSAIAPFAPSTNKATNCSDTSVHVAISYTAHQDVTGNVSVSASVTVGSGAPVTGMMTWAAGSAGATNATDSFIDDVCAGGGAPLKGSFAFSLEKTTQTLSIVYTDADLNAGTVTYTAACTLM
jgi:hypothetical protein